MTKNLFGQWGVLLLALLMVGCADKLDEGNNPVVPEPENDYTIMMYGTGGGNLDGALIYNLDQIRGYGYSEKVKFRGQVKFSDEYQQMNEQEYGGTRLITNTPGGLTNERMAGKGYRMDDPKNLAAFIKESKEAMPAKKYILVLWNHGSTFDIYDQPLEGSYPEIESRSVIYDDNTKEIISIFELEEGLKLAGGKLDMVYMDVCLMNMVENLYQISNYTDYVMGAAHLTPGMGGNYAQLMLSLESNETFIGAIKEYVAATCNLWKESEQLPVSLTVTDMKEIEGVVQQTKGYVAELMNYLGTLEDGSQEELRYHYMNGTKQNTFKADGGVYYLFDDGFWEASYSVDLNSGFSKLASSLLEGSLSAAATKLNSAMKRMVVTSSAVGIPDYMDQVSVGIYYTDSVLFNKEYAVEQFPVNTMAKLYPLLRFDQVTGWSQFLEQNSRKNVGYKDGEFYDKDKQEKLVITGSVEDPADLKEEDLAKLTAYMKMLADKVMEERPNITEAELFEISDELFENAEAFVNQEKMLFTEAIVLKFSTGRFGVEHYIFAK